MMSFAAFSFSIIHYFQCPFKRIWSSSKYKITFFSSSIYICLKKAPTTIQSTVFGDIVLRVDETKRMIANLFIFIDKQGYATLSIVIGWNEGETVYIFILVSTHSKIFGSETAWRKPPPWHTKITTYRPIHPNIARAVYFIDISSFMVRSVKSVRCKTFFYARLNFHDKFVWEQHMLSLIFNSEEQWKRFCVRAALYANLLCAFQDWNSPPAKL